MVDTLQTRERSGLACSKAVFLHRQNRDQSPRFCEFPIIGYSLTSDTVSANAALGVATYDIKPR